MEYTRFEDLPVWKAAIEFALKVLIYKQSRFSGRRRRQKTNLNAPQFPFQTTSPKVLSAERRPN